MRPLNNETLAAVSAEQTGKLTAGSYDRHAVKAGIVHFGVGNFHRCHQAVYVDKLLSQGDVEWGIVGISMRSAKLRDQLAPQDFLYTQVTLGEDSEFNIVGSLVDVLLAPENPTCVVNQLAEGSIKLITTTITEKGYCLSSGQVDSQHPDFLADHISLEKPKTIYGYLAAGIIQRRKVSAAPLTVLCCDNIQAGGEKLKQGVNILLKQHDSDSADWANKNVSFASSMVDRVSPATDEPLKQLVQTELKINDAWPVSAEPFSQWVIEDNFAGPRPAFDRVGAVFAEDISLYEQMKLRFLNAGHSVVSVLGYLDNRASVHEALQEPCILEFVLAFLHEEVLPVATLPKNSSGEEYISAVVQRFKNSALPYTVQQVNTDSSQKIQQRWFPSIDDALARNAVTSLMSASVAAWILYVEKALEAGDLNDPLIAEFSAAKQHGDDLANRFLTIAGADQFTFFNSSSFRASILSDYTTLRNIPVTEALKYFLSRREATIDVSGSLAVGPQ